ncbi:unnamed protein product [Caenorhabditis angaria]|uniref:Tetraspanin n=1 Tax=Caenorhabditis angaria TaxID=860376 RepID=A0A9P1I3V5_9PELO|nr:unnamed protein product [Caenorhabditis angaria]
MVEGGVTIVKYLLFLANLVLWVGGLGLIIFGSILKLKYSNALNLFGDEKLSTPILFLIIGALCTMLGFLGCCGAIRENYCLTVSFAVLLALLITCEIAAVIIGYALNDTFHTELSGSLENGLKYYNSENYGVKRAWDSTQKFFQCCGIVNSTDWIPYGNIPESCCTNYYEGCISSNVPVYSKGCIENVQAWTITNGQLVGGICAILAAVQLIGVCFACCLSKSILKDFHDFYY